EEVQKKLCESLCALLAGHAAGDDSLPRPSAEAPAPLLQACDLLRAASAFVSGKGQGYDALLAVMRRDPGDLASFTDPARLVPALCASSPPGKPAPTALVEAVQRMQPKPDKPAEMFTMARCAAAVGETDLACRWFEMALPKEPGAAVRQEYVDYLAH